jgi:hypothetical protein
MSSRALKREQKLQERCQALADVLKAVGEIYRQPDFSENQKHFIETMIGAALWYLPIVDECWTGKISIEAIKSCHPESGNKPKLTADHEYPRKIAAANLLAKSHADNDNLADELCFLYQSKYGKFNYITPRENKTLVSYQRKGVFENPLSSYQQAGIRLLAVTKDELSRIKARDREFIESLLKRAI